MAVPPTGLAVGLALEKVGRLVDARDKLLEVARLPAQPKESPQFRDARTQADSLQAKLAERIPSLQLEFSGLAAGLAPAVRIDGVELPSTLVALPRKLDPGKHAIVGVAPGYQDVTAEVMLAERDQKTVPLAFVAVPKAIAAPSLPAARPTTPPPVVAATEARSGWARSPLFWSGVGLVGVGAIAGSITGVLSLNAASEAKSQCPGDVCPDAGPLATRDRSLLLAHLSTGSFALAGVGAALAVVSLVVAPSRGEPGASRTALVVGPTSLGVAGAF